MTIEIISEDNYPDYQVWTCDNCGRKHTVPVGSDVAWCQCEFEEET